MPTTIIYKSETLQTGEKFTLPPDSVLIGADDVEALDSTCDIPVLENMACYEIVIIGSREDDGSPSHPYEEESFSLTSMNVGGVEYNFDDIPVNFFGVFNLTDLKTYIAANIPILIQVSSNTGTDTGLSRGGTTSLCFKTLPSLASNIYITASTNYPDSGSITMRYYAQPRGTYTGVGECAACEAS